MLVVQDNNYLNEKIFPKKLIMNPYPQILLYFLKSSGAEVFFTSGQLCKNS